MVNPTTKNEAFRAYSNLKDEADEIETYLSVVGAENQEEHDHLVERKQECDERADEIADEFSLHVY